MAKSMKNKRGLLKGVKRNNIKTMRKIRKSSNIGAISRSHNKGSTKNKGKKRRSINCFTLIYTVEVFINCMRRTINSFMNINRRADT